MQLSHQCQQDVLSKLLGHPVHGFMIFKWMTLSLRRGEVVGPHRQLWRRERHSGRRDVEIISHNQEDEFAKMPQGDSEGDDDDEAKVSELVWTIQQCLSYPNLDTGGSQDNRKWSKYPP